MKCTRIFLLEIVDICQTDCQNSTVRMLLAATESCFDVEEFYGCYGLPLNGLAATARSYKKLFMYNRTLGLHPAEETRA